MSKKCRVYLEPNEMRFGLSLSETFESESRFDGQLPDPSGGHLTGLDKERSRSGAGPHDFPPRHQVRLGVFRPENGVRRRRISHFGVGICELAEQKRSEKTDCLVVDVSFTFTFFFLFFYF